MARSDSYPAVQRAAVDNVNDEPLTPPGNPNFSPILFNTCEIFFSQKMTIWVNKVNRDVSVGMRR